MHTRLLPLKGFMGCVNLMVIILLYLLVCLPMWQIVHTQHIDIRSHDYVYVLTGRYAALSVWVLGFFAAFAIRHDEYTPGIIMLSASAITLVVITPPLLIWLPFVELAFGVYTWERLLDE